ncbi:porin, partial [Burkholderia sp. BCC1640]|uniref:porin n=1 Tax=Burkholderia sp. BCC1640 TaxID=2676294 RepID=UPI001FC85D34
MSLASLAAMGSAHAQSSVTLYGLIDTSLTYINHADGAKNSWLLGNSSAGNLAGSRWGIKGSEDLGSGLKAIFQLENGFNPSTGGLGQGGREFGRQAFVGLASDRLGTLTLGRQYDPLIDLVQPITADNYFGSAFATAGDVDNYDNSFRVDNAVKYTSPLVAGVQFEAMYSFGGIARIAGQYVWGAFTFGGGYSNAQYRRDGSSLFGQNERYNTGQGFLNYQATAALLLGVGYSYTKASGDTSATYHQ